MSRENENDTWFCVDSIYQPESRGSKFLRLLFGPWAFVPYALMLFPMFYFAGLFSLDLLGVAGAATWLFLLGAAIFRARKDLQKINQPEAKSNENGGQEK